MRVTTRAMATGSEAINGRVENPAPAGACGDLEADDAAEAVEAEWLAGEEALAGLGADA